MFKQLTAVSVMSLLPLMAHAADDAAGGEKAQVSTSIPGVQAFLPLPKDFNPETASNDELLRYGLPPRPNRQESPVAFKAWQSRVEGAKHRIVPELQQTNVRHPPINIDKQVRTRVDGGVTTSNNWSGYAITGPNGQFSKWGSEITGSYMEPAPGCDASAAGDKHASIWVGIDGYGSPDVLQTGTEVDVICPAPFASPTNVVHYAWYEWYPAYSIAIQNMTVRPGDKIDVAVFTSDGTHRFVSIENASTFQTFTLDMSPPAGTTLLGNSVEWVVERPEINGVLTNLAHYGSLAMQSIYVWYQSPGGAPQANYPGDAPSGTIYTINMVSGSNILSAPSVSPIDQSIALFSTPAN
jgi:hypothetical protein